jgi:effector-binding domain-containing protein
MNRVRLSHALSLVLSLAITTWLATLGCQKEPPPAPPSAPPAPAEAAPTPTPAAAAAAAPAAAPATAPEAAPEAAPTPAQLVDRAIAAAGGLELLRAKLSAMTIRSTGTYAGVPYEMTTWWKAPDRMVMDIGDGQMMMGYVGAECWSKMGDVVIDCPPAEAAAAREMQLAGHLLNLYPLKDPGVTLAPAEPTELDGREALGVVATVEGGPVPVTLWFDAETWLLLAVRFQQTTPVGPAESELTFSEPRQQDGVTLPAKSRMSMGGQLLMADETTRVELGGADETKFQRPPQAPLGQPRTAHWPAGRCAATTFTGPYEGVGATLGKLFGWVQAQNLLPLGPPMLVYRKGPGETTTPEEYVTEVRVAVGVLGPEPPAGGDPALQELPETDVVLRLEKGPYHEVAARHGELSQWAAENGWDVVGPPGMTTYSDPTTVAPAELLSELWFPVRKK